MTSPLDSEFDDWVSADAPMSAEMNRMMLVARAHEAIRMTVGPDFRAAAVPADPAPVRSRPSMLARMWRAATGWGRG